MMDHLFFPDVIISDDFMIPISCVQLSCFPNKNGSKLSFPRPPAMHYFDTDRI